MTYILIFNGKAHRNCTFLEFEEQLLYHQTIRLKANFGKHHGCLSYFRIASSNHTFLEQDEQYM